MSDIKMSDVFIGELTPESPDHNGDIRIGDEAYWFLDLTDSLTHEDGKGSKRADYICKAVNSYDSNQKRIEELEAENEALRDNLISTHTICDLMASDIYEGTLLQSDVKELLEKPNDSNN